MSDGRIFYFHFLHVAYFLKLTDYADAQADLRLCCLHATKSSFSQQGTYGMGKQTLIRCRDHLFSVQMPNCVDYNVNLSINLVVKQDAFSNIFFLICCGVRWCIIHSHLVSLYTFIVYVSSYVPGKTVRMCRLV